MVYESVPCVRVFINGMAPSPLPCISVIIVWPACGQTPQSVSGLRDRAVNGFMNMRSGSGSELDSVFELDGGSASGSGEMWSASGSCVK